MTTFQSHSVLKAVQEHPACMSPVLLEHLLRGEVLGRMAEKGLLDSPHFGIFSALPGPAVAALIEGCLQAGWLKQAEGFYPALSLTLKGEDMLMYWCQSSSSELSSDTHYKAYYRWRQGVARALRKPPYRIVPNATLNQLAMRRPTTLEDLLRVPGLGKRRALRYHKELLEVGVRLEMAAESDMVKG